MKNEIHIELDGLNEEAVALGNTIAGNFKTVDYMRWDKGTLSDYTSKIGSGVTPRGGASVYQENGTSLFRSQNIYNGSFSEKGLAFISEVIAEKMQSVEVLEGDVLLNITGDSVARCCYAPISFLPGRVNQHVAIVRAKRDKLDSKFLMYQLISPFMQSTMLSYAEGAGATRNALTKGIIEGFSINLPPLPTQRKIASILSAYDDLIENNLKRIKLLEEAMNINYKNLISTEDKNFSNVKLNSFVDIISGFPFKSNYYNENGKYKIVTIKNVQDGFFVPAVTDRIEDIPDNMNKALFLSTGDVIMSLTGNVGRVCLVYGDDYVLNQRVVKLSAKELIDQSFIYALVRDKQMLTILENLSNGTAQQNLSPIKMGELPIKYPSSNQREDFNQKVSPMIEMICKLNIQNTKLREARDILLPKLMNGQIVV
jgi:type I restriction enzyme S subunit